MLLKGAASVLALLSAGFAATGAWAQDSAPPTPDASQEVVVVGIRKSLQNAVQTKRNADSIVDAISAEDMGAFPDQNMAESLQRVTGIQITRDRGEGRDISIRGLDPKFAHITFNGDGLTSISGASINATAPAPNRSFDFTVLSSDFVGALVVYKTPTADIEEGGLAGSVDVRTLKPLDLRKRKLAVTMEAYDNEYTDSLGSHSSLMYADQFFGRKLGIALGYEYSKRFMDTQYFLSSGQENRAENQYKFQGQAASPANRAYTNTGALAQGGYVDFNGDGDNLDAYRLTTMLKFNNDPGVRTRTTYNIGLQWRPTAALELRLDGLAGRFQTDFMNETQGFHLQLGADPNYIGNRVLAAHISPIQPQSDDFSSTGLTTCNTPATTCTTAGVGTLPVAGILDYADMAGEFYDNFTKRNSSLTNLINYQLSAIYKVGHLTIEAQGGYNETKKVWNTGGMDAFGYQEAVYDQRTDIGGIPSLSFGAGAARVANPATYYSGGAFYTGSMTPQSLKNHLASLDVSWRDTGLSWLTSVKAGYKYTDTRVYQGNVTINASAAKIATLTGDALIANSPGDGGTAIDLAPYMTTFGGSDFLSRYDGASTFPKTWLGVDTVGFLAKYPLSQILALPGVVTTNLTSTWLVQERNQAAYVRFDFSLLDGDLTGNAGVRAFKTYQSGATYTGDLSTLVQTSASTLVYGTTSGYVVNHNAYDSALPSLNIRYQLDDNKVLRFGAARTITRPDISNLVPGNGSINLIAQTATLTNTSLKPYYADNYDVSAEWYLSHEALLSVDWFYKYIRGYYVTAPSTFNITYKDLNGNMVPLSLLATTSVNGSSTSTRGLEISYQQPFTMLPAPWDGLGVIVNYTGTLAGRIQTSATSGRYPLPFVSKDAYNLVMYYEKNAVSARLSYNWRGAYVENPGGFGADPRGGSYVKAAGYVDFSSKYQIDDRTSLTLNGTNLLDTPVEKTTIYGFGRGWEVNGRTWSVGLRYSY
jgi:TonB-dependent receptor